MDIPSTLAEKINFENSMTWEERGTPPTVYSFLTERKEASGNLPAVSFQILSDPKSKAETLTWNELHQRVTQAANLFRSMGIHEKSVVAFLLPNCTETAIVLLAASVAGIVNPINPLLDSTQIAGILNASKAEILVTLKPFPKTNVPQLAAEAVSKAPNVKHVLEVDLCRYLSPPKSWIANLIRPKNPATHAASVSSFNSRVSSQPANRLTFADSVGDRVAALFHTGGTTGIPKLAQHTYTGIIFNGWAGKTVGLGGDEVIMCPLPLFHVFAAYPAFMSAIAAGAHIIFPTPAGYRGEGVIDNFWKLVERWRVTYFMMVPTAGAALMQRPVDSDVSTLKTAICGSAPMPLELYRRFEESLGIKILEGYGLTEATCLVSINPLEGERKVGSVGIPVPYAKARIIEFDASNTIVRECGPNEGGEICISSPGVLPGATYLEAHRNEGLFAENVWLRTGDLGYLDEDGYLWITGRAKDLIIRGGQNVDPAWLEEPLSGHESVAFVGAVGQPDAKYGELPCAYVELVVGGKANTSTLMAYANDKINSLLARPAHIEILDELPKTAVGKVFKPDLRKRAIRRVLNERLKDENLNASVADITDDAKLGLSAVIAVSESSARSKVQAILDEYSIHWEWENH